MTSGQERPHLAGGLVCEIDLDLGAPSLPEGIGSELIYLLLRWRGRPVGRLVVDAGPVPPLVDWRRTVLEAAAPGLAALGQEHDPLPGLPATDLSVVIATRDRPGELARCLTRIQALDPAPGQVVVADSASSDAAAVAQVVANAGAELVRLDRPGLSRARNAGATAATCQAVVFLDDDCQVDPGWLKGFGAGFTDESVHAVTGQLLPAELETPAQRLFLRAFHMDRRGWVPQRFDATTRPSRYWPLDSWRMGSGGNMAVRRAPFLAGGGFRTDLGLGTPSRGGEDLFFLWDTIRGGGTVVYRPDAMAWHRHHRSLEALSRVMFGYGAGHAAYLRATRQAGAPLTQVALYTLSWLASRLQRLAQALLGKGPLPAAMVLRELAGGAAGPVLARRAQAAP